MRQSSPRLAPGSAVAPPFSQHMVWPPGSCVTARSLQLSQSYGLVRTGRARSTSKVTDEPSVVVVPGTSAGALPLTVNVAPQVTVR
jgi:hypothetical protein